MFFIGCFDNKSIYNAGANRFSKAFIFCILERLRLSTEISNAVPWFFFRQTTTCSYKFNILTRKLIYFFAGADRFSKAFIFCTLERLRLSTEISNVTTFSSPVQPDRSRLVTWAWPPSKTSPLPNRWLELPNLWPRRCMTNTMVSNLKMAGPKQACAKV